MAKNTPAKRIPQWRSQLHDAWIVQINDTPVTTYVDVKEIIKNLDVSNAKECKLLFSHQEVKHTLINNAIPQINIDQLNNRLLLRPFNQDILVYMPRNDSKDLFRHCGIYTQDEEKEEDVINLTMKVTKLTRSKLHKQEDWNEWERSEFLQLDQYDTQFMFREVVHVD